MSITTSVPPNGSGSQAFSSIFSSKKPPASRQKDVIYTLSSAVSAIEQSLPGQQHPQSSTSSAEDTDLRAAITQASSSNAESDMTHLDGVPVQELRASIQDFAKRLRPFNPPPPPVPMDSSAPQSTSLETSTENQEGVLEPSSASKPTEQHFSTVLTIRETSNTDGSKSYEAYTSPFVRVEDVEAPSSSSTTPVKEEGEGSSTHQQDRQLERSISDPQRRFLRRMALRHLQLERFRDQRRLERMYTISVKRQRKLKIKRHKHKKLLRKTRTLRRKLDKN